MSTPSSSSPSSPSSGASGAPGSSAAAASRGHDHDHDHGPGCGHDHQGGCGHAHAHGHDHSHNHSHGAAAGEKEWTRNFLLFLELAVLLIWAVTMVWFYASGRINNYLIGEGTFRIQVLVGGLLLAVLGLFNWKMRGLLASVGCGHDHGHDCGHDHSHDQDYSHSHGKDCGHDHDHDHNHSHSHSHGKDSGHSQSHMHQHAGGGCCSHEEVADPSLVATKSKAGSSTCGSEADCCGAGAALPGHDEESHGGHDHEGTPGGRGLALALLAISVTSAVAFTPDDFSDRYKKNMLSAYSSRKATDAGKAPAEFRLTPEGSPAAAAGMTLAVVEKYRPRNKDGNFELGVEELYYSSADPEYAKVMKGQGVETLGQIVKDTTGTEPGRWRVFILQMTCCAADARPISLPVVFETEVPNLQEMGWFKLKGTIDYVQERGIPVAILRATGATPSLRPKDQRTLF
ncbi:MAG: hypothetical protein JWL81_1033 [Verrucomicrobiales bacterium]|nr:hypothetical protein [Verrucomicrobiales bacterium]